MNIKFSHNYTKLRGEKSAKLLSVIVTGRPNLSPEFLEYDTIYQNKAGENCFYELGNHAFFLMLLLIGERGNLFTTVRPYTLAKEIYYRKAIGSIFEVVVENAD